MFYCSRALKHSGIKQPCRRLSHLLNHIWDGLQTWAQGQRFICGIPSLPSIHKQLEPLWLQNCPIHSFRDMWERKPHPHLPSHPSSRGIAKSPAGIVEPLSISPGCSCVYSRDFCAPGINHDYTPLHEHLWLESRGSEGFRAEKWDRK